VHERQFGRLRGDFVSSLRQATASHGRLKARFSFNYKSFRLVPQIID